MTNSATSGCTRCGGAGYYALAVRATDPRFGKLQPCECTQVAQAVRLRAEQRQLLGALADELGPKLARCTFDSFRLDRAYPQDMIWGGKPFTVAEQQRRLSMALTQARVYAERPLGWIAFFGPTGTGKSHLAAAIANTCAARGEQVSYASAPELIQFLRNGMADYSVGTRLEALKAAPVLVLDDLGTEVRDDRTDEWIGLILNHRSMHDRPTVITSNAVRTDLEARIADRIDENARVLYVVATSYRAQLRRAREEQERQTA